MHVYHTSTHFTFASSPQDGWTAVLLAARYGHKEVVQELCETFEADLLHRKKVTTMKTISGSEWLSTLCMYLIIMYGCTQSAIYSARCRIQY